MITNPCEPIQNIHVRRNRQSPVKTFDDFLAIGSQRIYLHLRSIVIKFKYRTRRNISQHKSDNPNSCILTKRNSPTHFPATRLHPYNRHTNEQCYHHYKIKHIFRRNQTTDKSPSPTGKPKPIGYFPHERNRLPHSLHISQSR